MEASASLLLFGDEQFPLPGIPRCLPPVLAVAPEPDDGRGRQCPGQLALGPIQMLLADADPEPLQPSLLPDPAPWEYMEALVGGPGEPAPDLARVAAPVRQLQLPRMSAWL